jgi:hypothetical protein
VAGYPNVRGTELTEEEHASVSRSIAPALDPGYHWQTTFVKLNPKFDVFKINAKDDSEGAWLAFSMPVIVNGHAPGRWARTLIDDYVCFGALGLALMILGAACDQENGSGTAKA